jgi:hypothetical protein
MKRKNKFKKETDGRFEDHDYHDYYKSARKKEKRNRRHKSSENIKDIAKGGMTPEEYEDYFTDDNN